MKRRSSSTAKREAIRRYYLSRSSLASALRSIHLYINDVPLLYALVWNSKF